MWWWWWWWWCVVRVGAVDAVERRPRTHPKPDRPADPDPGWKGPRDRAIAGTDRSPRTLLACVLFCSVPMAAVSPWWSRRRRPCSSRCALALCFFCSCIVFFLSMRLFINIFLWTVVGNVDCRWALFLLWIHMREPCLIGLCVGALKCTWWLTSFVVASDIGEPNVAAGGERNTPEDRRKSSGTCRTQGETTSGKNTLHAHEPMYQAQRIRNKRNASTDTSDVYFFLAFCTMFMWLMSLFVVCVARRAMRWLLSRRLSSALNKKAPRYVHPIIYRRLFSFNQRRSYAMLLILSFVRCWGCMLACGDYVIVCVNFMVPCCLIVWLW